MSDSAVHEQVCKPMPKRTPPANVGVRSFKRKLCARSRQILPIAQLVERETVVVNNKVILMSLVRFRLGRFFFFVQEFFIFFLRLPPSPLNRPALNPPLNRPAPSVPPTPPTFAPSLPALAPHQANYFSTEKKNAFWNLFFWPSYVPFNLNIDSQAPMQPNTFFTRPVGEKSEEKKNLPNRNRTSDIKMTL